LNKLLSKFSEALLYVDSILYEFGKLGMVKQALLVVDPGKDSEKNICKKLLILILLFKLNLK